MKKFAKLNYQIIILLLVFFIVSESQAQLSKGNIAFIGLNTDATEGYSIITLAELSSSEKIFFSDRGIIDNSNYIASDEGTYLFTAPVAGVPCGTIISFAETSADVYSISGVVGATMVLQAGSANLGAGDQVYAYQTVTDTISSNPSDATFLGGIMSDYDASCVDPITKWTQSSCVTATSESILPPGLKNTKTAVSLTPTGPEADNFRYTGTLIGSSSILVNEFNDFNNWESNDDTAYDISPTGYGSPNVSCDFTPVELMNFSVE